MLVASFNLAVFQVLLMFPTLHEMKQFYMKSKFT